MFLEPILRFFQGILTLGGYFQWDYVWSFLFASDVMQGIIITLLLSVLAQFFGSLIGLVLYFMRRSGSAPVRGAANLYIWFFRGSPLLVQILFLSTLFPYLHLVQPLDATNVFRHLGFTIAVLPSLFVPALLALSFNEGAYMSEIVRAGIDSIDAGQLEAAKSLGMTYGLAMRRIVLPQALRVIVPPLGNEFNSMLKNSALASTIGVTELLAAAHDDHTFYARPLEFLVIATIWFLVLTTLWGIVQAWIERKLNASNIDPALRERGPWLQRVFGIGRKVVVGGSEIAVPIPTDHR